MRIKSIMLQRFSVCSIVFGIWFQSIKRVFTFSQSKKG